MTGAALRQINFQFRLRWRFLAAGVLIIFAIATEPIAPQESPRSHSQGITVAEFSRIVQEFSEEDGYFRSDNFVSNETSYLHVIPKLRELQVKGGAYIGVGPEQNFTYIAKIRPAIAFVVDIRRQAMIQHLMYKAIFHRAQTRTEFLSLLFSLPLEDPPPRDVSTAELLKAFQDRRALESDLIANTTLIRRTIEEEFRFALAEQDVRSLEYVLGAFAEQTLEIQFNYGRGRRWANFPVRAFPTLQELILEKDLEGRTGNFLASHEDYKFVRDLHRRNRIIPVVGDFSGEKALPAVARYLKEKRYRVSAFYTSNVEQFLFGNGVFGSFADNVRRLPIDEHSVFIRAFTGAQGMHPAWVPGHRLATVLQHIRIFLRDYDQKLYPNYWSLLTTNFIKADLIPERQRREIGGRE